MPPDERASTAAALSLLAGGRVEVKGRMPWSSNATFLVSVSAGDEEMVAVYKPRRGEQMLWDFPTGLYLREVAAYELSEALGWSIVPETTVREDGPFGQGSIQRFVAADFAQHYYTLLEDPKHLGALRRIAAFDVLANNADRKSGHCLLGEDGRIWGIDHGLCFHEDVKLRTVLWDFAGEEIDADLVADIAALAERGLPAALTACLEPEETRALAARIADLVARPVFPHPTSRHAYPWPLV